MRYRIKRDVRPYGGKILEVKSLEDGRATGFVRLSRSRIATAARTTLVSELEPIQETSS